MPRPAIPRVDVRLRSADEIAAEGSDQSAGTGRPLRSPAMHLLRSPACPLMTAVGAVVAKEQLGRHEHPEVTVDALCCGLDHRHQLDEGVRPAGAARI